MFNFIIRYTQQVAEDSWSVRHKSVNLEVPGLSDILKECGSSYGNPHVIGVNPANSENIEPKTNTQHAQPEICPRCGGSGQLYMCAEDGEGRRCPKCNGSGKLQASVR